jgi:hypothetical protein
MITFEDLKFTTHSMGDGIHATMDLKNGNTISVIKTPYSYGGKVGLYELAVIDSNGKFLDVQGNRKDIPLVLNKTMKNMKLSGEYFKLTQEQLKFCEKQIDLLLKQTQKLK